MKFNSGFFAASLVLSGFSIGASARTLELQTTQVTAPDVAVSPDDQTLVFTMLGHLFSLPLSGGMAEQLTFGQYFDEAPAFSPDGSRVAFSSDRDGSEGNIFVLTLQNRQLEQLTHEELAGRPTWSPDGESVVYLRYARWTPQGQPATVSRISIHGGDPEILSASPEHIGSSFYLPDGRLAWSVIEQGKDPADYLTRIDTLGLQGGITALQAIPGLIDYALPSPSGDGLYCHRVTGVGWDPVAEDLIFVSTRPDSNKEIVPVAGLGRFALSRDGRNLFIGDRGYLWRVQLPAGGSQWIRFLAHVKVEATERSEPPRRHVTQEDNPVRAILTPRLAPDGRTLVFGAAGFLWRQRLDTDGKAQRISRDIAIETEPAFSPGGHQLAYVSTANGAASVRLFDMVTGETRELASGPGISELAWSADGRRLVAQVTSRLRRYVMAYDVADGKSERITDDVSVFRAWSARPQFSADGHMIYYSADIGGVGNLYRRALDKDAKAEQITHLIHHLSDARVSPDEKWLAFRRNHSIFTASLASGSIQDSDVHELSAEGGDSFAITPDGSSVIYAVGRHIWQQPVSGSDRREIPVRLDLAPQRSPPVVLQGTRVLDMAAGHFGAPTSLLIENGRIQWIGSEQKHKLPINATLLDASGRFAIPGLFDFHAHASDERQEAFIAYGVTSLRDTGDALASLGAMQDRSEVTNLAVPRYFYSGDIFEGSRPIWGDRFLQIEDERDAREYVRRYKREGAGFIKVYPSLSWPLIRAVAGEARRLGLPIVGHGVSPEEIIKSASLGFFSIEHSASLTPAYDDLLQLLAASGTSWDPTVAVMGGDSLLLRDEPEQLTDPKFRVFARSMAIDEAMYGSYMKTVATYTLRGKVSALLESIQRANRSGVILHAGTDVPNPECFAGISLHWELARLVEAGLSPLEVLRIATANAASAVGAEDLGTIEPGKAADIVLLRANPLENIRNTETVWRVIKMGWIFDPQNLK